MGMYDFDAEPTKIPPAFARRFGDCRVPTSSDIRAWKKGRLSASGSGRHFDVQGRAIVEPFVSRWDMRNPRTGKFMAAWKPMPKGGSPKAARERQRRGQFKKGDGRTAERARGGRKGGRSRSDAKLVAVLGNLQKRRHAESN